MTPIKQSNYGSIQAPNAYQEWTITQPPPSLGFISIQPPSSPEITPINPSIPEPEKDSECCSTTAKICKLIGTYALLALGRCLCQCDTEIDEDGNLVNHSDPTGYVPHPRLYLHVLTTTSLVPDPQHHRSGCGLSVVPRTTTNLVFLPYPR